MKMPRAGHIFYGWWIVLAAAVGLLFSVGPVIVFTLGIFLKPLSSELHWSRAEISLAFTLCTIMTSLAIPLVGGLVDRHGARRVVVPSLLLFGMSVASLSFLTASLWHLYAVFLLIELVASGCTPLPYARMISEWFDKRRGLALGFTMAGVGVGTFVMPSLAQALVQFHRSLFAMLHPGNNGDHETPNVCWSAVEHATAASGERPSLTRCL